MASVISEKEGNNLINYFVNMPEVKEVTGKSAAKAFVKLNNVVYFYLYSSHFAILLYTL